MEINSSSATSRAMPIGLASRPMPATAMEARITPGGAAQAFVTEKTDQVQLEDALKAVNAMPAVATNAIAFSIDKESGKTVVKLVGNQTNEVIRQFPSKAMLAIARDMTPLKGWLISEKS